MTEYIQLIDRRFFLFITKKNIPDRWFAVLKIFVRLGDGWFWLPIVLGILLNNSTGEFFLIIKRCLVALAVSVSIYYPIKLSVRRLRPFQQIPDVAAEIPPMDKFSFPSGHTMHNLAVGLTIAHYYPLAFWPLVIIPFAWGFFRIYFGVHFLSDILAGGILGVCSFQIGKWIS